MGLFGAIGDVIDGAVGSVIDAVGSLFSRSISPFEEALSMLTQQFNVVQEMAKSPMQAMISQVTGGIWTGDGADQFVQAVQSIFIPNVDAITSTISGYSGSLTSANSIVEQADSEIRSLVESTIGETFNFF